MRCGCDNETCCRVHVASPLPEVAVGFLESDARMQPTFDVKQFGNVMAELRSKRSSK